MTKYVVANWKMNGDLNLIKDYAQFFQNHHLKSHLIVCPPSPYVWASIGAGFDVGAQDCHFAESGAHTGNVSAKMLKELGCTHVIVGHSERRLNHMETDGLIHKKAKAAIDQGLIPIICIGESIEDRENEETEQVLMSQLKTSCPDAKTGFMVAYEPIWAIGTGKTATPSDIEKIHELMRTFLGDDIPLLYGGSVNAKNAYTLINLKNVDGVLVGGASLKLDEMKEITDLGGS